MQLSSIAQIIGGTLVGDDCNIERIITEPDRAFGPNSLLFFVKNYIVKPGQEYEGYIDHDPTDPNFFHDADPENIVAFVWTEKPNTHRPVIIVEDVKIALAKLGACKRAMLDIPIIGITGSLGKTTTRLLLNFLLAEKFETNTNEGNANRLEGLTRSLLNTSDTADVEILEVAAFYPGDMELLCAIVNPDIGIITNCGPIHLDLLGDLDNIAKEKAEIIHFLRDGGTAILNADDDYFAYWQSCVGDKKLLTFGIDNKADIMAKTIHLNELAQPSFQLVINDDQVDVQLQLLGKHQVRHALAASAAAHSMGLSIDEIKMRLEQAQGFDRRLKLLQGLNGSHIIDDTFGIQYAGLKLAIEILSQQPKRKILVLTKPFIPPDMNEEQTQRELGAYAKAAGIEKLYIYGNGCDEIIHGFGNNSKAFSDKKALIAELKPQLNQNTTVLVTGKIVLHMEEVVESL